MALDTIALTPPIATALFVTGVFAGIRYRSIWKNEGPRWQLWAYGIVAALALLLLGFVPMQTP